jgi:hypothetical protein
MREYWLTLSIMTDTAFVMKRAMFPVGGREMGGALSGRRRRKSFRRRMS